MAQFTLEHSHKLITLSRTHKPILVFFVQHKPFTILYVTYRILCFAPLKFVAAWAPGGLALLETSTTICIIAAKQMLHPVELLATFQAVSFPEIPLVRVACNAKVDIEKEENRQQKLVDHVGMYPKGFGWPSSRNKYQWSSLTVCAKLMSIT